MSDTLYDYIEQTGVIVPDTGTLLTDVQAEFTGVFGSGLNVTNLSTPQGLIISAEVAARSAVVNNNAALANQINPNQAGGVFLDAICALTGLLRSPDTFTTVQNVVLTGQQGSPIAAGSIAHTPNNDQFALLADVILDPVTGQAIGTFVAVVAGPIPGPSGSWTILTDVLGWETVSNPTAATSLGTLEQSDQSLADLRRRTLALQGVSIIEAILSAVNNVAGVIGSQGLENITDATEVIQGVTMISHSFWICVDGGLSTDIAAALLANKSGGAGWNGAQSVTIVEPVSRQSYNVLYDLPTDVPLTAQIIVSQGTFVGDPTTAVVQAVVDFGNNAIAGLQGFSVGENASPFEIASGILSECPGLYIKNVEISLLSSVSYAPAEIPMAIYQKAIITGSNVIVTVV